MNSGTESSWAKRWKAGGRQCGGVRERERERDRVGVIRAALLEWWGKGI